MLACCRMLFRVSCAVSNATSTSRIRDSAALRFSLVIARLLIVLPRRFWTAPSEPRSELIVLIAESMFVMAVVVEPLEPIAMELDPEVRDAASVSERFRTSTL